MAKQIRQVGRALVYVVPLVALALFFLLPAPRSEASTYTDPFWTNSSPSPECLCADCPCERPSEWSPEGVSLRTGDFVFDHTILDMPGRGGPLVLGFRWRAMVDGASQLGNGILPSWEITVEYVELDAQNPWGNGGNQALVRRPSGLVSVYDWTGSAYVAQDCQNYDALVLVSNLYVLTDKWGNSWYFNSDGMPASYVSRNGCTTSYSYNGSLQLTSITDDRGGSYTIGHDQDGFIDSIEDPTGREWGFSYDAGNLETIRTPATTDQQYGITTTFGWDAYDRLVSVTDGRSHTVLGIAWVGTSRVVDTVTIDGDDVTFDYYTGRTERTDRAGVVHRAHHSGTTITQTDLYGDSQAEFVNLYRYNGSTLINRVFPRGNRIDFTVDGWGNLTQKRYRETDTSTNQASDIVHSWTYDDNFVETYTNPEGATWTYGRDAYGNLTSVTHPTVTNPDTQPASETFTYNGYGQRLTHVDEEGLRTQYVYFTTGDEIGLLEKIQVGPDGQILETSFTYDAWLNVATRTDPRSNAWSYTWDSLRRMKETQAPSPLSFKTRWVLDANGNVVTKEVENRDKDGDLDTNNPWFTTTYTYTNLDQVATITEEIDASTTRTTSVYYDDSQRRVRVTKPEGNEETWTYNERGLVASHTRGYGSQDASTVEYLYDDNGNPTVVEDGRDYDTTTTWDLFDRRTRVTNAIGAYTEWTLDKDGMPTVVARYDHEDALLLRRTNAYDERGRLWQVSDRRVDPGQSYSDAVTTIERLTTGHVAEVTNALSETTTYAHDVYHRVESVTDAAGNLVEREFDANGNLVGWSIEETDGTNTVTHEYEATYDAANRRLATVEIDRTDSNHRLTTTSAWDSRGNLVWQVDAEGSPTRWTFDGLGRMIQRERALVWTGEDFTQAQVTVWGFDDNDRLVLHRDDGSNDTTWTYDALDRPGEMEYPDASTVTYDWDLNDNLIETVDGMSTDVDNTYDSLNRLTARTVTRGTGVLGTTSETYTYDDADRILTAGDDDYKVTFTYAALGLDSQVYSEQQEYVGGTAYAKTVTRTYDALGRKARETYPSNLALTYGYSAAGAMTSIADASSTIVSYSYWGTRLKGATFGNGTTQTNTYGGFRQDVTSILHEETSPKATIVRLDYGYDDVHNRLYERYGGAGASGDAFVYDAMHRLVTAYMGSVDPDDDPSTAQYVKKIVYNYDDDGNRTSVVTTPWQQTQQTESYTTNALYQYTAVGGVTHDWDDAGNLSDDGSQLFAYDYRNQLVEVRVKSTSALIASYRYDALGRRVEKALPGGVKERYILSGLETVATYDASNTWKQDFVFAAGIDQIVAMDQRDVLDYDGDQDTLETVRHYYHCNALGSVMAITDADQAVAVSYRYDPYGTVTITRGGQTQSADPLGQHLHFRGMFLDEETGLLSRPGAYYDAAIGVAIETWLGSYGYGSVLFSGAGSIPLGGLVAPEDLPKILRALRLYKKSKLFRLALKASLWGLVIGVATDAAVDRLIEEIQDWLEKNQPTPETRIDPVPIPPDVPDDPKPPRYRGWCTCEHSIVQYRFGRRVHQIVTTYTGFPCSSDVVCRALPCTQVGIELEIIARAAYYHGGSFSIASLERRLPRPSSVVVPGGYEDVQIPTEEQDASVPTVEFVDALCE